MIGKNRAAILCPHYLPTAACERQTDFTQNDHAFARLLRFPNHNLAARVGYQVRKRCPKGKSRVLEQELGARCSERRN